MVKFFQVLLVGLFLCGVLHAQIDKYLQYSSTTCGYFNWGSDWWQTGTNHELRYAEALVYFQFTQAPYHPMYLNAAVVYSQVNGQAPIDIYISTSRQIIIDEQNDPHYHHHWWNGDNANLGHYVGRVTAIGYSTLASFNIENWISQNPAIQYYILFDQLDDGADLAVNLAWLGPPGSIDSPLPVGLASFTAVSGDGKVTLNWTTQSEVNNVRFDIMKSEMRDGEYSKIGEQQGQFNSNELTNYSFIDNFVANGSIYWYKLVDVDINGIRTEHGPINAMPQASSIPITTINSEVPKSYKLYPGHPNPFNPSTTLRFDVPVMSKGLAKVKVEVYNSLGQKVRSLFNGSVEAGTYSVIWNGMMDSGSSVSGGTYFAVFTSGHYRETVKMTLVK